MRILSAVAVGSELIDSVRSLSLRGVLQTDGKLSE